MLFDPARHEALQPLAWDEGACRAAIQAIVDDTERHFSPERYWPPHPRDIEPGDDLSVPGTSLYYGACGVIWALQGFGVLQGSPMSNTTTWSIIGPITAVTLHPLTSSPCAGTIPAL